MITGASSGVGRETCIRISNEGGRVVLVARNEVGLRETLSQMSSECEHIMIPFDLTDLDHYDQLFNKLKKENIVLDGLVHCAGIASIIPLRVASYSMAIDTFKIHFFAFVELVKWFSKRNISKEGSSIVGISSTIVNRPVKCMTMYGAAKAGVEAACPNLALELADKNIRVNCVRFGSVITEMVGKTVEVKGGVTGDDCKNYVEVMKRDPRNLTPNETVGTILFLLSNESKGVNGKMIVVNGGSELYV